MTNSKLSGKDWTIILLVGFGYFVDLYDLMIFSVVRAKSLIDIGISDSELVTKHGLELINVTVWGMLIGSFVWGFFADRFGRKSTLLLSILTYSLGSFLCYFVTDLNWYFLFRFITGIGIAGELGAGLTLVSESVAKDKRSIAATLIGAIGMFGAITAAMVGKVVFWRYAYVIGTVLGLLLLFFRTQVKESEYFQSKKILSSNRGNLLKLFKSPKSVLKYFLGILVGLNIFFVIGAYVSLSPELGKTYNLSISAGDAIIVCYLTVCVFDIIAGLLSIQFKSRKKIIFSFLLLQLLGTLVFYFVPVSTSFGYFLKLTLLCSGVGMWAMLNTYVTELFGTDIRGTVAVTTPNIIRWVFIFTSGLLLHIKPLIGIMNAITLISVCSIIISLIAITRLEETFEVDTDFPEFDKPKQ